MNMIRKGFIASVLIILLTVFFGCEVDSSDKPFDPPPSQNEITASAAKQSINYLAVKNNVNISEWGWTQEDNGDLDFTWFFNHEGCVTVTHCCGLEFPSSYYLTCGNVLLTYGFDEKSKIEATTFTITEAAGKVTLTKSDGMYFTRKDKVSPFLPFALSNNAIGTWKGTDGTKYEFTSDAKLQITAPSGYSEQYGYLTRTGEMIILGPLVDGKQAGIRQYWFNTNNNNLTLRDADGKVITLSPSEL